LGAEAVWVGTRFLASEEAAATKIHKAGVVRASASDLVQSLHFSGRPCRMLNTEYVQEWNGARAAERDALLEQGKVPLEVDQSRAIKDGKSLSVTHIQPLFMGQVCGAISEIQPVDAIIKELVGGAIAMLTSRAGLVSSRL